MTTNAHTKKSSREKKEMERQQQIERENDRG